MLDITLWDDRCLVRNDLPALSPVLVLCFIEGVLGYRHIRDINGVLMYRRDRAFECSEYIVDVELQAFTRKVFALRQPTRNKVLRTGIGSSSSQRHDELDLQETGTLRDFQTRPWSMAKSMQRISRAQGSTSFQISRAAPAGGEFRGFFDRPTLLSFERSPSSSTTCSEHLFCLL